MIWINSEQEGLNKHLLIDIKKAFDSINRLILLEMLKEDFKNENFELLSNLLEIYNTIEIDILDLSFSDKRWTSRFICRPYFVLLLS